MINPWKINTFLSNYFRYGMAVFFLVLEGELEVEIEGREAVRLKPMEGVMVPKGVRHKTKAPAGATVLMVEQNTIVPTGS